MATQSQKRWLIVVTLAFGLAGSAAAIRWLSTGEIVIRKGATRVGARAPASTRPQPQGPVAGRIERSDLPFYPLCLSWLGLGLSMMALPVLAFFTSNEMFLRLSAYSCVAVLILGFLTVGTAILWGP